MAAAEFYVENLDPASLVAVARQGARVTMGEEARERVGASRGRVEIMIEGALPVYGVTTGFGALANTRITAEKRLDLQHSLLRSHAAGMGEFIEPEIVRAMMAIRAKTLSAGYSGVRPELIDAMVAFLNADLTPAVPEYGSMGASGDLAPLAHVGLCLVGEGRLLEGGEPVQTSEALALINGTDGMLAMLLLSLEDLKVLLKTADLTAAMSVEALLGTDRVFREDLHALRTHPGQLASAVNISKLLSGSPIVASHRDSSHLVQDAYSLRCAPQVFGAARDTLDHASLVAGRELASVTDNPVVLPDGRVESGGNFHGEPLALVLDFLAIAASEVGAITERRIDRMLDPRRSEGLPAFLSPRPGVNSGFMIPHYTAAALAEENRRLANPASTGSLPISATQEDHNSMGWSSGRKLRQLLDNVSSILAVEAACAAQALDLRDPLMPARATGAVLARMRQEIPFVDVDTFMAPHLEAARGLVSTGTLVESVERAIGPLA